MFRAAFIFPPPLGLAPLVTGKSDTGSGVEVNAAVGCKEMSKLSAI